MTGFHGLAAFPLTPADDHGIVDTQALGALVERLGAARVDVIGLLGSTGIYAYLDRTERLRAVRAAVEAADRRVPVMVGVAALRTDTAQGLARDAADAGADALLLSPMSYTPLCDDEVFEHFAAVAAATDLPMCIYNNPTTTHFTFSHALLARLAGVANIRAVKMPGLASGDYSAELQSLRHMTDIAIGYSGDWIAANALLAGADAWYSVLGGLLPRLALDMTCLARTGDEGRARAVDAQLDPLWGAFRAHGSIRVMYAFARFLGVTDAAPPLPIHPLGAAVVETLVPIFETLRIIEGSYPQAA